MEFDKTWSIASLVHLIEGKNKFQANVGHESKIFLKVEFGLISQ
jgi:hypothetical protein